MRLKYAITIGDPKSPGIEYQGRATGSSHLTRVDVIAAMGMAQAHQPAGMALITAKYIKGGGAMRTALLGLEKHAQAIRGKYLGKDAGKSITQAVALLAAYVLEDYSRTADTPGAKCLCGGRCEVQDMKESKRQGCPVMKPCSRCKGTGLRPLTQSRVHHALLRYVQVSQPTYSRRWKPFYDELVSWCYQQESAAERCYNDFAGLRPLVTETGDNLQEVR
ncbi:antitermination protein [Citrobacter sp. NCU1]|uniref:antitermination protein n=1 Tax=Citrobacter sp. NCU1 TaxID=2026683 RepID=UPI001391D2BC|nr:antitermination protein [Citrobacter sp. NCU1]